MKVRVKCPLGDKCELKSVISIIIKLNLTRHRFAAGSGMVKFWWCVTFRKVAEETTLQMKMRWRNDCSSRAISRKKFVCHDVCLNQKAPRIWNDLNNERKRTWYDGMRERRPAERPDQTRRPGEEDRRAEGEAARRRWQGWDVIFRRGKERGGLAGRDVGGASG